MKRSTGCAGVVAALGAVLLIAPAANANVTVISDSTAKGSAAALSFRVPDERDDAGTTTVEVDFPVDHPLGGVTVESKPGWSFSITRSSMASTATPSPSPSVTPTASMPGMDMNSGSMPGMHMTSWPTPTPGNSAQGSDAAQMVTSIVWTATDDSAAIKPGSYDLFTIQVPALPSDTDTLTFRALQTYSSGEVVRWIDEQAPGSSAEPAHPAPILHLSAPAGTAGHGQSSGMSMQTGAMPMHNGTMSNPGAGTSGMSMSGMAMSEPRKDTVNVALGLAIGGLFAGVVAGTLAASALHRSRARANTTAHS